MSYKDTCNPIQKSKSYGKIKTDSVAWFTRKRDPQQCNIFGFRNSETDNGDGLFSTMFSDRPDEIICGLDKCDMTGTIFLNPANATPTEGEYLINTTEVDTDSEPFQFGYLRVLVYGKKDDELIFTVKNKGEENGNQYNITLNKDGWQAVVIEMFQPDTILGTGWIASPLGFNFVTEVKKGAEIRLSTLELFDNKLALIKDATIGFRCITDFSGDPALTITEDLCTIPTYDDTATTIERQIVASEIIGEIGDFAPMFKRNDQLMFPVKRSRKIKAITKELHGVTYGAIELPDLAEVRCPYLVVQPQNCEYDLLSHMQVDGTINKVDLPEDMYFVENETVYVKKTFIDYEFIVAYPRMEYGTAWDITTKELNQSRYMMEMITPIGGKEYQLISDNILATAIPLTWTREAGTMTIPYSMVKNGDGKFGTFVKLDNNK